MSKLRGPRITKEFDNKIIELMKVYGNLPNCYVIISEKTNKQYTSKQIRQRWISTLDPKLHQKPLGEDEKSFIIQWVENNRVPNSKIRWKPLISEIEKKFGKLRSENMVKNFWNLRNRKSGNKQQKNVNYDKNKKDIVSSLLPPLLRPLDEIHQNVSYDKNKKDIVSLPLPPLRPLEDEISPDATRLDVLCFVSLKISNF
ncbi:hypothetical protein C1645_809838 [Glomus cerebriforme]|uniref:HTH myb-type domain-containing protein n=1 Tax=Glomus cerebriforme TaxID=658196 RepID=A0A397SGP6_9GLOM|nr:hypothetical protein C1645_809838 [Glomus cerebriforme]